MSVYIFVADERVSFSKEGRVVMSPLWSALKMSRAACVPERGPSHCSALGSLGRTKSEKVWSSLVVSLPMTARASGSLKPMLAQSESYSFRCIWRRTCEVGEVGVLMEFVEDIMAFPFDVCSCKDCDGALWQFASELGPALGVFEGGDTWSHFKLQVSALSCNDDDADHTLSRLQQVRMCFMDRLTKLKVRSGDGAVQSARIERAML